MTVRTYRAPGKLLWIGEYAVLDGAPALVAAVDRHVVVTADDGGDGTAADAGPDPEHAGAVRFDGPFGALTLWDADRRLLPAPPSEPMALVAAVARTLDARGIHPPPQRVSAESSALSDGDKLGLGSSGAVAAGLVAALTAHTDLGADERLTIALDAHRAFQGGRGSGSDVYASSLGGLLRIAPGSAPRAVAAPAALRFAVIATGVPADTRTLIGAFRDWTARPGAAEVVTALRGCSERGIAALEAGDVSGWCDAVAGYLELEIAMTDGGVGVVNAPVRAAVDAAQQAGWVAKPSGAGGGDIVVAFGGPTADVARLDAACAAAGVARIDLALEPSGVLDTRQRTLR